MNVAGVIREGEDTAMPLNREAIENLRKDLGISQETAGERAGFGSGMTAKVRWQQVIHDDNDPRLSNVEAIAVALHTDVNSILQKTQKRRRPSSAAGSKG